MRNIKKIPLVAMLLMAIFSVASLFNLSLGEKNISLASFTLIVGIPMYFIAWRTEKTEGCSDVLDIKAIPNALKDKNVIFLLLMPIVMNAICNIIAKLVIPEFIQHLITRTDFLTMSKILLLLIELVIAALGEEIAWRAFFQNQLTKAIPFVPSLIISSALFAICHCTQGEMAVVLYDLLFVFINALFYGMLFKKTNNAFVSALAHFLANLFGIVFILLL